MEKNSKFNKSTTPNIMRMIYTTIAAVSIPLVRDTVVYEGMKSIRKDLEIREIKDKIKFIFYLCTNYPKRNYNRVFKKMKYCRDVKEWQAVLDKYKKKYKVQV